MTDDDGKDRLSPDEIAAFLALVKRNSVELDRLLAHVTKTEFVVRLLKDVISGAASVELEHDLSSNRHCFLPVKIGATVVTFWMRNELRRVASVSFSDGSVISMEELQAERWLPPRAEFGAWWGWMRGHLDMNEEEIWRDSKEKMDHFHAPGATDLERLARMNDWTEAHERLYAFEPLHYLTDGEQDLLAERLKNAGKSNGN